jgi:flavin reductase (DIM6/NTAB) family NADH-FMN oxidoreductase RutF
MNSPSARAAGLSEGPNPHANSACGRPRNGAFAVNILSAGQQAISHYFASSDRPRGRDAFAEIPHRVVTTGAPVLEGVAAFVDCRLASTHEEGDHLIIVGEVQAVGVARDAEPLLFHRSGYRTVAAG